LTKSLSGLNIPVLTFGNGPRVVIIVGRVHPGESHSSWVIHGLISFLSSNNAQLNQIKELLTFKIVPMINPDGVIAGNYRTSFIGKDLNRLYVQNDCPDEEEKPNFINKMLIPEIAAMK